MSSAPITRAYVFTGGHCKRATLPECFKTRRFAYRCNRNDKQIAGHSAAAFILGLLSRFVKATKTNLW